jgi:hypothetical protein
LVNDAPTTVAAKMPQASTILSTTFAAKFQRRLPQEMPQRPTMDAARFNEVCRSRAAAVPPPPTTAAAGNAATVSRRKTAQKTHPEKTGI